jgi:hypothetical protein
VFATVFPFHSIQYLQARQEPTQKKPQTGLHCKGRLIFLPVNIRLGWKWQTVKNTLAYYDVESITTVESFLVLAKGEKEHRRRLIKLALNYNISWSAAVDQVSSALKYFVT